MSPDNGQLEVTTPLGSAKISGREIIFFVLLGANIGASFYTAHEIQQNIANLSQAFWEHRVGTQKLLYENRTIVCMSSNLAPALEIYCKHIIQEQPLQK